MAVFKCKMCGGTLEINNETVAVCQYCGTKQTLPKLDDDRKANLYDRANHFRRNNEFDKAMGIYEQILNDDNTDAETYWSLVLCRYGIEYVEDPSSHKRIPTVNRAQFTSIFDDEDYKSALQYADGYQKVIYEQEATAINDIQKGILAISSQEEPFDVFICYKESDNSGRRTPDSVLATELYHELTREGYKVFFSRITLEDKLGTAYEPYIFAALNSAKVMVVLGTKPEFFNAVWVKNEWSRYLALIKNGARKMLIPAYKDMDPYDLPEEFSHLQAQDMSKLGFMQDLIRGIKKIVESNAEKQTIHETFVANEVSGNVTALLKRGYMALEDGEWSKADDFFEQCLNQNAELAEAYLGKLMAELQVKTQDRLKDCAEPFDDNNNYQKIIRFGDNKLKTFLGDIIQFINKRNEDAAREDAYNRAYNLMNLNNEGAYIEAAQWFAKVPRYKDADTLAEECREKAELARKDRVYKSACEVLNDTHTWVGKKTDIKAYEEAIAQFQSLDGWKDSEEKILLCQKKIEEIKAQIEKEKLEKERQTELNRIEAEKRAKRNKKIAVIATPITCAMIAFIIVLNTVIIPNGKYNDAIALMNAGKYAEAITAFESLGSYKDSDEKINLCFQQKLNQETYNKATELLNCKNISRAYLNFRLADNYKDSSKKINDIVKQQIYNAKVGDIIYWGLYNYSSDYWEGQEKDVIRWIVLDKSNNKMLLIADDFLAERKYDSANATTWKDCELRQWLNNEFIKEVFSENEINYIVSTNTDDSITKDKIFLLSDNETNDYFDVLKQYAHQWGSTHTNHSICNDWCSWGLRTLADNNNVKIACQCCQLNVDPVKCNDLLSVRPAMWIDIENN